MLFRDKYQNLLSFAIQYYQLNQFSLITKPMFEYLYHLPPHIQWASRLGMGTRDLEEVCMVLAREDGIPASSVVEMRNEPDTPFAPPATLLNGCFPRVFPRDTLLPVMTRALDELQGQGIDPNKVLSVVRRKVKLPSGAIAG